MNLAMLHPTSFTNTIGKYNVSCLIIFSTNQAPTTSNVHFQINTSYPNVQYASRSRNATRLSFNTVTSTCALGCMYKNKEWNHSQYLLWERFLNFLYTVYITEALVSLHHKKVLRE